MTDFGLRASGFGLAILAVAACRGSGAKTHRTGSAAPVEMVAQPSLPDAGTTGTTSDEIEPNDADDVATPLTLGAKVRGKIEPETDVDHYRIDVPKAGALAVMVGPVDQDLIVEIEDSAGNVIARSQRGGVRMAEGVPNLGVTPGRYTAVVRAAPPKKKPPPPRRGRRPPPEPKQAPPAPVYEITARLDAPATAAEREPDDDRGTANDLLIKDSQTGFIGWTGDQDEWKLSTETLAAKQAVEITVGPVEGLAIELEITDALGQVLLAHKGARGDGAGVHNFAPQIAPGAPPFAYVVVRADKSNPETAYQLHTDAWAPNPDDELEPDDTPDKAFPIAADRTVVHAWWEYGDIDCFAAALAPQPREVDFLVDTPSELDLAVELFVDGKSAAKVDHPGKGVAEKVGAPVPPNGHAVACIRAPAEGPGRAKVKYDVHVQESAGTGDNAP